MTLIESELERDEGYKSRPYLDTTGHLTIGIGHNLNAAGLCRAAILAQLRFDIAEKEAHLDAKLPWWRGHPPAVQRVLVNLAFNLGIAGLLTFTTTLAHIKAKRYAQAADALMANKRYVKQIGQRANRLAKQLRSVV